jgi:uncharacterized protein
MQMENKVQMSLLTTSASRKTGNERKVLLATEQAIGKNSVIMLSRRLLVYVLGMLFLAMGVSFSIKSNLGVSPMSSLPYVVSQVMGIDMGLVTTVIFSLYVLLQIIILRREFKLKNLFQVAVASIFGLFLSLTNSLLFFPSPEVYTLRLFFLGISLFLIALGLMLYLVAELIPQPTEGLLLALQKKSGKQFSNLKIAFDCIVVVLAILISAVSGYGIMGMREGTLIAALLVGKIIGLLFNWLGPFVRAICFGKEHVINQVN